MSLQELQENWEKELVLGHVSALADSPAFREAMLRKGQGFKPGWYKDGPSVPAGRSPAGTRRKGLAYERKIGVALLEHVLESKQRLRDHEWLLCSNGRWLQPDFVIESPTEFRLFEVKLTFCSEAFRQLAIYTQALEELFSLPVVGCLVCKNLSPDSPSVVTRFEDVKNGSVLHLPFLFPG